MNEMLLQMLKDAFDPGEFIEFLDVSIEDIVEAFPDEVEDAMDDLKDMVGYDREMDSENDNEEYD